MVWIEIHTLKPFFVPSIIWRIFLGLDKKQLMKKQVSFSSLNIKDTIYERRQSSGEKVAVYGGYQGVYIDFLQLRFTRLITSLKEEAA